MANVSGARVHLMLGREINVGKVELIIKGWGEIEKMTEWVGSRII